MSQTSQTQPAENSETNQPSESSVAPEYAEEARHIEIPRRTVDAFHTPPDVLPAVRVPTVPPSAVDESEHENLADRLAVLETLLSESEGRLSEATAEDAARAVVRVHERVTLSPDHVVTAIAGATGSGKSSLFNALIRFDLAPVGAVRPTTMAALACVWDPERAAGAEALLDRVGVPERNRTLRGSLLDSANRRAEPELAPLVLIDLPDHDSAVKAHRDQTDRAAAAADLLLFVTDPQKYADASWHERYLMNLTHHQEALVVVLNKIDELEPPDAAAIAGDLERLLHEQDLTEVPVVVTSTVTGEGLHDLRNLIAARVWRKQAALLRSQADIDRAAAEIAAELRPNSPDFASGVSPAAKAEALAGIGDGTGMRALSDLVEATYRRRASAVTGWPIRHGFMALTSRARGDEEHRYAPWTAPIAGEPAPPPVQRGDVEASVGAVVDLTAGPLPEPWGRQMRRIGDRCVQSLAETLDATLSGTEVSPRLIPRWWTAVQVLHWMLLTAALVGFGGTLVYFLAGGAQTSSLPDTGAVPFPALVALSALGVGAILDIMSRAAARRASAALRIRVAERMTERVRTATEQLLFAPLTAEHERYLRAWALSGELTGNSREKRVPLSGGEQGHPSL